jgi:hypothetical protein
VIGFAAKLGDRLLERLAPKATAKADTTWYEYCYCTSDWRAIHRICHAVGGTSSCGPCNHVRYIGC